MDNHYAIWTPKYDGHAPPFWNDGMAWGTSEPIPTVTETPPKFLEDVPYKVLPEAVNALFDAAAWLEQGRANLDKLPDGVVLPEAIDWAFEVWRAANEANESGDENEDAITVIRNLCQPREQSNDRT